MSSELVKALKAWDTYDPNISEEKVLRQAHAVIDAARPLPARIEALEAENARLWEDRNRYERQICAAEHGHTINDVLANYRQIRRAIQDRRAREGGNADG